MHMVMLALALGAAAAEEPDTLVVCPPAWVAPLEPWLAHRRAQGHRLAVVPNPSSASALRTVIREIAAARRLQFVLLVGDAEAAPAGSLVEPGVSVPTYFTRAQVNVRWGSEPEIATDNWYADLDDDQLPDLALGRLPVDSPEELARVVRKIVDYEQALDQGAWQRQIHVVAGVGGFGTWTDTVLELAARKFLTDGIPAAYCTTMTYGSWQSPFCPDPRRFQDVTRQRLNDGGLFWVYLGHGRPQQLGVVPVPGGAFPILEASDPRLLVCRRGQPVAILMACYAGAFDGPRDCLAEELLKAPGGPAAVLAASRVTMPYGMAVLGEALLHEYFRQRRATLGELVQQAKRRLAEEVPPSEQRQLLDALATAFSPAADQLSEERREHCQLFHLFGDPLLRLPYPEAIAVETEATEVAAGQPLLVTGHSPIAGPGLVELACRRDRFKTLPPARAQFYPTDAFLASFNEVYRQANDGVWCARPVLLAGGPFRVSLAVPEDASGPCHVRMFVQGERAVGLGAADILVRRPANDGALTAAK